MIGIAGLEKSDNDISGTECVSTNRHSSCVHETDTAHQAFDRRRSNALARGKQAQHLSKRNSQDSSTPAP